MSSHPFAPGEAVGAAPAAIDTANVAIKGRIIINDISCYVPHFTSNMAQDAILSKHILSRGPTELTYIGRSIFNQDVPTAEKRLLNWL